MAVQVKTRIKNRWDSAQAWRQANPILLQGEIAVETENGRIRFKAGDGQTKYVDLPYAGGSQVSVDGVVSDFGVLHISQEEYARRLADGSLLSSELYIVSSDYIDAYGQQLKNLSAPTEISDAATKGYVDDAVRGVRIPTDLSSFTNSPGYLVSDDVSGYYQKSETSSAIEINNAFELSSGNKVFIDDRISSSAGYSDLSIVKLSADEYTTLLTSNQLLSNLLYVVEDDYVDVYGEQIKNVAYPTDLSDAATKEYVDNALSNVLSGKQDSLTDGQISAINEQAARRATVVTFTDNTVSSYDIAGTVSSNYMSNLGKTPKIVKLGAALTSVGSNAFSGCFSMTDIYFPKTIVSCAYAAFPSNIYSVSALHVEDIASFMNCNCSNYGANPLFIAKNLYFNSTPVSSLTVPEEVATVQNLQSCHSLKHIEIHKNAKMRHNYVFQDCPNLTSIVFRNRLSSEIPAGKPWGATNATVSTWNDASQEWVEEKLGDIEAILSSL